MIDELQKLFIGLTPLLLVFLWQYSQEARRLPYPPGPKPLPMIGNLLDVPTGPQWLGYSELSSKYGTQLYNILLQLHDVSPYLCQAQRRSS